MTTSKTTRRRNAAVKAEVGENVPDRAPSARFDPGKLKPGKPGQDPIAVIGADGHIFPFTNNHVDRFYLMGMGVTYIYDEDDLKEVVRINGKAIQDERDDRIVRGMPLQPKAREPLNANEVSETIAQAFSPTMLDQE